MILKNINFKMIRLNEFNVQKFVKSFVFKSSSFFFLTKSQLNAAQSIFLLFASKNDTNFDDIIVIVKKHRTIINKKRKFRMISMFRSKSF